MADAETKTGFSMSVGLHGALLAALAYGLIPPPPRVAEETAMEVSFVDEAGLTSAAPTPSTEAPEIGAAPDVGTPQDAAPEPLPTPAPPEPQPPAPRQAVAPPRPQAPAPRQKATPQRPQQPTRQPPRPSPRAGTAERTQRSIRDDRNFLKGLGRDRVSQSNNPPAQMTGAARSSMRSLIARALMPCENQPFPSPQARAIKVQVRVTLNRNGSLASAEVTSVRNGNPELERYERRMRDLALAVVRGCTPMRGLPDEYYDVAGGWRQFNYQFPRDS